ncbi:hypothetical protein LTS18_013261, partial [Coniosporium uncinatum]
MTRLPVVALLLFSILINASPVARTSPQHIAFEDELQIPPTKKPLTTYTDPETGKSIDFYEVEVQSFRRKFFPTLGAADL